MKITFSNEAWDQYVSWQKQDKRTINRINCLLKDIIRGGHESIGKPEALQEDMSGFWSRRIDESNRLVYSIVDDTCYVIQCRGHY